jgi:hypothetical protein
MSDAPFVVRVVAETDDPVEESTARSVPALAIVATYPASAIADAAASIVTVYD